jgi:hypothetical protein
VNDATRRRLQQRAVAARGPGCEDQSRDGAHSTELGSQLFISPRNPRRPSSAARSGSPCRDDRPHWSPLDRHWSAVVRARFPNSLGESRYRRVSIEPRARRTRRESAGDAPWTLLGAPSGALPGIRSAPAWAGADTMRPGTAAGVTNAATIDPRTHTPSSPNHWRQVEWRRGPDCIGFGSRLNSPLFRGPFLALLSPASHHLDDLQGGATRVGWYSRFTPSSGIAQMVWCSGTGQTRTLSSSGRIPRSADSTVTESGASRPVWSHLCRSLQRRSDSS